MKRIKKAIYLEAITFVIVGLVLTSTANIIAQEPEINENKVITQILKTNIKPTDSTYSQEVKNIEIYTQPSETLGIPLFTAITPAIADSGSAMAVGFNAPDSDNVYFAGSTDFGQTWTDGIGWQLDEAPELPAVDGCGDGRLIASMVPNGLDYDGGAGYVVQILDVTTQDGYYCGSYSWNDVGAGYTNFIDVECGGYTAADPAENEWAFGGYSIVGDHGNLGDQTGFFSYVSSSERSAWIYTLADNPGDFNGATSTGMDIDQETLYSYAVYNYDNSGSKDILLFIMDFGQWGEYSGTPIHENNWVETLATPGNDNKLDVSALNQNVIIVSERDGNIIAYYANGLNNLAFSEKTITTDATEPRITHYDTNMAVCEFIKNGDSYSSYTEDGGVTWSSPKLVSEEENIVSGDVCARGYAYESDGTVYFAPTDFTQAILQIESISGGFGVTTVVKNIGTAAAENVDWSIVTEGTVFLNGEKTGQVTIQPGESRILKSGVILGFGDIDTTVTIDTATKKASGKLLLFFILGMS